MGPMWVFFAARSLCPIRTLYLIRNKTFYAHTLHVPFSHTFASVNSGAAGMYSRYTCNIWCLIVFSPCLNRESGCFHYAIILVITFSRICSIKFN